MLGEIGADLCKGSEYVSLVDQVGVELIGDDQHIVVDGRRLTAADRHFEMVYDIDGGHPEFPYRGHVNEHVARHKNGAYYP